MALVTFDIPNAFLTRYLTACAAEYGYSDTLTNPDGTTSPNPETKAQFGKRMAVENWFKQVTRNYEANIAAQDTRKAKEDEVNSITIS